MTRWNLVIANSTERALRALLARSSGRKGGLSRFVGEAVRRRVYDLTVETVKSGNVGMDSQEILDLIDAEVEAVRALRSTAECRSAL